MKCFKLKLYDVLRLDSAVVIDVLVNVSSPKLTINLLKISKHRVYECASGLTSIPKAE